MVWPIIRGKSYVGETGKSTKAVEMRRHRSLDLLTKIRTQRERAVIVQLLVTSPAHGIAHALYLDLSSKFQAFPLVEVRKHELRLPNLARQRVTGVETAALEQISVLALDVHPQYPRHSRDSVICEADNQPQSSGVLIAPDERRPHPITDAAIDVIERCRIRLVVGHQIGGADLVKVPERPVIRPDINHMRDHVFCRGYPFNCGAWIGRFTRKPLLEQSRGPGWAIAERFDLLVLNKDGIAANPIVAADRAVQQF